MDYKELEQKLKYEFKDASHIKEALSHPSLRGEEGFNGKDYERLEFLGDTVVNLVVTNVLYNEFPDLNEGELAKIRSYLISKDFMVQKALELDLGKYIIMGIGEEASGGRNNPNNLENVLEAIMGAIYLDRGIDPASDVIVELWGKVDPSIGDFSNPKSNLQELLQYKKMGLPKYEVVEKTGEVHSPTYKVMVRAGKLNAFGTSGTIKNAEKQAAENMIQQFSDSNENKS
jgi:ribonuclease III